MGSRLLLHRLGCLLLGLHLLRTVRLLGLRTVGLLRVLWNGLLSMRCLRLRRRYLGTLVLRVRILGILLVVRLTTLASLLCLGLGLGRLLLPVLCRTSLASGLLLLAVLLPVLLTGMRRGMAVLTILWLVGWPGNLLLVTALRRSVLLLTILRLGCLRSSGLLSVLGGMLLIRLRRSCLSSDLLLTMLGRDCLANCLLLSILSLMCLC